MSVSASISSGYHHVSSAAASAKHAVEGKYDDIKQTRAGVKAHSFAATLKKITNVPVNFVKSHPKLIAGVGMATTAIGGLTANPAAIGIGIALIGVGTLGYMSSRHAESKAMSQTTLEMLQNPNKMAEMKNESALSLLQKAEKNLTLAEKSSEKAKADADKATVSAHKTPENAHKSKIKDRAILLASDKADALKAAQLDVAQTRLLVATTKVDCLEGELKASRTRFDSVSKHAETPEEKSLLEEQVTSSQKRLDSALAELKTARENLAKVKGPVLETTGTAAEMVATTSAASDITGVLSA